MRFKYYLRGCGFGILITAVILMIGFHRSGGGMSDADIMQRASELGMVTPEEAKQPAKGEELPKDTEMTAEPAGNSGQGAAGMGREPDSEDNSGLEPVDDSGPDSEGDSGPDSEDGGFGKDEPKTVTIRVRRYEVCEELAEELADLGLLQDAREFCLYMYENGYDGMLHVGKFTFAFGMDMEEIAKILISDPE